MLPAHAHEIFRASLLLFSQTVLSKLINLGSFADPGNCFALIKRYRSVGVIAMALVARLQRGLHRWTGLDDDLQVHMRWHGRLALRLGSS